MEGDVTGRERPQGRKVTQNGKKNSHNDVWNVTQVSYAA